MDGDIEIAKWADFPAALADAANALAGKMTASGLPQELYYRGLANAEWDLETTLERRLGGQEMTTEQYVTWALRHREEVQAVSGRSWDAPKGHPDIVKEIEVHEGREKGVNPFRVHLPAYSYLVYLRQHGFASPLLDWTKSPFIAAYFALHQANNDRGEHAAIHVFDERPDGAKGGSSYKPFLQVWGPFTDTHQRHFVQQACYTTATKWDAAREKHVFVPHKTVVAKSGSRQDMRVRILIPHSERLVGMKWLAQANINHYTLFQTEDSLVQAIESRVFDLELPQ